MGYVYLSQAARLSKPLGSYFVLVFSYNPLPPHAHPTPLRSLRLPGLWLALVLAAFLDLELCMPTSPLVGAVALPVVCVSYVMSMYAPHSLFTALVRLYPESKNALTAASSSGFNCAGRAGALAP